jgi:Na+/proline symporter
MLFNHAYDAQVANSQAGGEYLALERDFEAAIAARKAAATAGNRQQFLDSDARVREIRAGAVAIVKRVTGDSRYNDVNYVFPTFITTRMPVGLVGLMIAAIFAAAMSASGGELNALATATIIDFYKRHFVTAASDAHYLRVSKAATMMWGLFACVVAMYSANQGSLVEVVNRFGSFFYGSLLGVFILAILSRRATAAGAFWGLIAGMAAVLTFAFSPWTRDVAFLWHNLIGAVVVVAVGMAISLIGPAAPRSVPHTPTGG